MRFGCARLPRSEPPVPHRSVLLDMHELNGDRLPDLVGGDRRIQVLFGDGQGGFSVGPWLYLEVQEYREDQRIPGPFVGESDNAP